MLLGPNVGRQPRFPVVGQRPGRREQRGSQPVGAEIVGTLPDHPDGLLHLAPGYPATLPTARRARETAGLQQPPEALAMPPGPGFQRIQERPRRGARRRPLPRLQAGEVLPPLSERHRCYRRLAPSVTFSDEGPVPFAPDGGEAIISGREAGYAADDRNGARRP